MRDALNHEIAQPIDHQVGRSLARWCMGTVFRDHRIVEHADFATFVDAGVDQRAGLGLRLLVFNDTAGRGQEAAGRIFRVNPRLEGPAVEFNIILRKRQFFARRDADHLLDKVDPRNQLGDAVLHLQARVHLKEIELALVIDDELHRTGRDITHLLRQRNRLRTHFRTHLRRHEHRRRFLDHLLVPALDGAFALAQRHYVAVFIGQYLDLDMARIIEIFLDEHARIVEARTSLGRRHFHAVRQLVVRTRNAHALPAAARRRFNDHRIPNLIGDTLGFFYVSNRLQHAGDAVDARLLGDFLRFDFIAHQANRFRIRPDPRRVATLDDRARKHFLFRQKPIARMHAFRTRLVDRRQQILDIKIRLDARGRADKHRFIGVFHMERIGIRLRINRDRPQAHFLGGVHDAGRDFPAVRDKDRMKHDAVLAYSTQGASILRVGCD